MVEMVPKAVSRGPKTRTWSNSIRMLRRGFSMVEMTVVIVVLALMAAAIMPNVGTAVEQNRRRNYRLAVPRLVGEAQNYAIREGQTVTMRADTDGAFTLVTEAEGEENTINELTPVEGVDIDALLTADGSDPGSDWQINFYPDGSSDGGVIELSDAGAPFRYQVLKSSGKVRRIGEDTPLEAEKWEAGNLAVRGGEGG
jgi:prepilin-type N-terminal cleavage/methylation domain-containing protein